MIGYQMCFIGEGLNGRERTLMSKDIFLKNVSITDEIRDAFIARCEDGGGLFDLKLIEFKILEINIVE